MENIKNTYNEDKQTFSKENNPNGEINQVIKPIDGQTVHKICSGQVVLTLAVAVKELIENALDAKATIIEVKLKEYGSELIEVSDNGIGVLKENFAALTLKHYTSKIKNFSDLEYVETLGFRGEALSSLCALSNVTILTRHNSSNVATKITYDHNGKILNECTAPRSPGTTVSLNNLFATLPVRRKEFLKNLKREFNKMCQLLYAYCLISTNVKLTCINQLSKGTKTTVVSTQGSKTIRDNIINVFGAKQIQFLIDLKTVDPIEDVLKEYGLENEIKTPNKPFKFECFISSVTHGLGRSIADRQFIYINSRPCEPTKIIKLINDTYRQFNPHQYPFIFLNILTERNLVDVNVTPDKRQIFFQKEKLLLAYLKSSLLEAFKHFPSTYSLQNLDISKDEGKGKNLVLNQTTINNFKGLKRSLENKEECDESKISVLDVFRKKPKKSELIDVELNDLKEIFGVSNDENKSSLVIKDDLNGIKNEEEIKNVQIKNDEIKDEEIKDEEIKDEEIKNDESKNDESKNEEIKNDKIKNEEIKNEDEKPLKIITKTDCKLTFETTPNKENLIDIKNTLKYDDIKREEEQLVPSLKMKRNILEVNLEKMKARVIKQNELFGRGEVVKVLFRAEISPTMNSAAEQELQKQITKDKFKEMEVIGQFNLGFIIAKLENDLFIIDQHATDEKYNFEQLQAHTTLETQILVHPKPLNLTAANENLLIENEEIFKKNGFTFKIDHEAEPTEKVKLTSIPLSKNYIFGKDDIDELLFILQETAQSMCRPSRIRQMFASRACRKSVMIGKALTHSDMRKLIDHMGEIDQPWNCPHGRPTMRHLVNLSLLNTK